MNDARIEPLGDDALLVHFGDRIDMDVNQRVHAAAAALRSLDPDWLRDLVPAYTGLAVFFDASRVDSDDPHAALASMLTTLLSTQTSAPSPALPPREIPVCYGGDAGPDLSAAARTLGLAESELIARHCAPVYTVAMIGFAPGFPYLLGLDPSLALPRLSTPRPHLPAGSVAIGGAQTGIYPRASPGGWQLLGRTPLVLFDAQRDPPALLAPGERVRFVPIDEAAFDRASQP